jgi:peroxisomal coenzyme A diphosphatase NUDT7
LSCLPENLHHYFKQRKAGVLDSEQYRRYAIFVPLAVEDGELSVIFEVRSEFVPQPGEICFPGGRIDEGDSSASAAAERELCEELGVSPEEVEITGELDYMVTPSKSMIFPFLGEIKNSSVLEPNPGEVKEIFSVPLKDLLEMEPYEHRIQLAVQPEDGFPYHLIPNGEDYPWSAGVIYEHFYQYKNYIIWGLTARILTHVLEEMKKARTTV